MDDLTANALCVGGPYDGYTTEVWPSARIVFDGFDPHGEEDTYRFVGVENGVRIYRWEA